MDLSSKAFFIRGRTINDLAPERLSVMDLEFGWGKMKDLGSVWFTMKGSGSRMPGTSSDWMSEPSVRVSWPESLEDPVSPASLVSDMQAMFDKIVIVGKICYC